MIRKIVILMIGILVLIAGCKQTEKPITAPASPYIGGSVGVIAEFSPMGTYSELSGTEEIFEGEDFPIEVVVKNKGEYTLQPEQVEVTLMGINLDDFENIPEGTLKNSGVIEGISKYNLRGGEETIDFTPGENDAVYKPEIIGASYDLSVFARVVYYYETHGTVPKVCFKGDLTNPEICEVEEEKIVFSSAGPIQVRKVMEKPGGTGKISLEFEIENVGGGDVTKPNQEFDPRYDVLSFEISEPDKWECKSSGRENEARLDDAGKATIICRLKEPLDRTDLYTKQVDLLLKYKYKFLIHKQLRIKKE